MQQRTINKEILLSGHGLHTNNLCNVTFCPAGVNHGIVFQRMDLQGQPVVEALYKNASEFNRNTTLKSGDAVVATIEHFMAAFYILGIDNLLVKITSMEMPILDGSAKPIVEALQASIIELDAHKNYYNISKHIVYKDENSGSYIEAFPDEKLTIEVTIDFHSPIGKQIVTFDENTEISYIYSARTFVFLSEIAYLYQHNLIKGGNLDNALVFVDINLPHEQIVLLENLFGYKGIEITPYGVLNNTPFRSMQEPAWHKMLDFIGDLSLFGKSVVGHIVAYKPGHAVNDGFVKLL